MFVIIRKDQIMKIFLCILLIICLAIDGKAADVKTTLHQKIPAIQ
jgi:hypothetical protein